MSGKYGVRHVGFAGYPDGHVQIGDGDLWRALHAKARLLADLGHDFTITTQFGFDAAPVLAWLARLRREGVVAPVRLGVAGPASVKTLLRFAARCGVGASTMAMSKYGLSVARLLGNAGPDPMIAELLKALDPKLHGATALHVYPFGGLRKASEWVCDYTAPGASFADMRPRARGLSVFALQLPNSFETRASSPLNSLRALPIPKPAPPSACAGRCAASGCAARLSGRRG